MLRSETLYPEKRGARRGVWGPMEQSFSNVSAHDNHQDGLRIQTLMWQVWGGTQDSAFPTSSQVRLMLPVQGPDMEQQGSDPILLTQESLARPDPGLLHISNKNTTNSLPSGQVQIQVSGKNFRKTGKDLHHKLLFSPRSHSGVRPSLSTSIKTAAPSLALSPRSALFSFQTCPTCGPQACMRLGMAMNAAQHKIVNLLKTLSDFL